jgi:hypothetical protein
MPARALLSLLYRPALTPPREALAQAALSDLQAHGFVFPALRERDPQRAEWMHKHLVDFRTGLLRAGSPMDVPVGLPKADGLPAPAPAGLEGQQQSASPRRRAMSAPELAPAPGASLQSLRDGACLPVSIVADSGQGPSIPTWFVVDAGLRRLVLRRQPDGERLAGAPAVERTFRVSSARRGMAVPSPGPL